MAYRMTKLEAVGRIGISLLGRRFPDLAGTTGTWPNLTYGADQASEIAFELDQVNRELSASGRYEGTLAKWQIVQGDASNEINFATTNGGRYAAVIRAVPSGKDAGRRWTMVGTKAWDNESFASNVFTSGSNFQWDIYVWRDFADCSTELQEAILKETTIRLQRRFGGSQEQDKFYTQEKDAVEAIQQRPNIGEKNQGEGQAIFMSSPQQGAR